MGLMAAKDVAEKWGISQRRVAILCGEGRIPGAQRVSNMWVIPDEAEKPADGRSLRYPKEKLPVVKPFAKWAGGKGQLLADIRKTYPVELGKSIRKYAEPFVGGGAVLFDILSSYELDAVYISDINAELMNTYRMIRDDVTGLNGLLSALQDEYLPMDDEARKIFYYEKRNRYNELKVNGDSAINLESAALFIFLNRTCFNGLYRVNRKSLFNVPIGSYKKPTICDADNLTAVSKALEKVTIVCGDYRESRSFIDKDTFVYFDPPYRPLNTTSSFTSYTEDEFDDAAQRELAEYVQELDKVGAYVVVSNSDPKNVNPNDNFFDELYARQQINRVSASRMINSNAGSRGKISELLICNY
ncbi:MAG TPA: DNA adenine methylase [Eubacteriales bacterium]|nr:DNA adenine methylase [Eubacteriales bacterium]